MASPVRFQLGELCFIWDPARQQRNAKKHGISFEEAATTWLDPHAIERPDSSHSDEEARWLRIGMALRGAVLVVWSTEREQAGRVVIRIIGARRATRRERTLYEEINQEGH